MCNADFLICNKYQKSIKKDNPSTTPGRLLQFRIITETIIVMAKCNINFVKSNIYLD